MISIDSTSATPASEQLRLQFSGLIRSGALEAGSRLPTIRQLAADLGLAPGTVARVYSGLEEEGYVETRRALGTRVAAGHTLTPQTTRAAHGLVRACHAENLNLDGAIAAVRAAWSASQGTESEKAEGPVSS